MCDKNNRVTLTPNQYDYLYGQQRGICPGEVCGGNNLKVKEKSRITKIGEGAHVYPLNPTENESLLLIDVEKINDDLNHLDNIILLCPNCHTVYDKMKTVGRYNKMLDLKKAMISFDKSLSLYSSLNIDNEIREIIDYIVGNYEEITVDLSLKFKKIEDKMLPEYKIHIVNLVQINFKYYYKAISRIIKSANSDKGNSFDLIASQIRTAYLEFNKVNEKVNIYNVMVDWLHKKTSKTRQACEIVIAYFIQNCEVFSDVST